MKKASMIRDYENKGKLNWKIAKSIITGEAMKDPNKVKPIKIQSKIIGKFFSPNQDSKDIENIIEKALEMYFQKQQELIDIEDEEGDEMLG
jgi:ParB family chromosome partitioning protein